MTFSVNRNKKLRGIYYENKSRKIIQISSRTLYTFDKDIWNSPSTRMSKTLFMSVFLNSFQTILEEKKNKLLVYLHIRSYTINVKIAPLHHIDVSYQTISQY